MSKPTKFRVVVGARPEMGDRLVTVFSVSEAGEELYADAWWANKGPRPESAEAWRKAVQRRLSLPRGFWAEASATPAGFSWREGAVFAN